MDLLLAELRAQTPWLRLLGLQALRPMLADTLRTAKQRQVYEPSDGERTTRDIAKAAGVGAGSVSRWWTAWAQLGLMTESPEYPGRWRHLASQTELGMDLAARGVEE
jgi:hypothetical protein